MNGVRQAGRTDRAEVTASIVAAFAHDPAWAFLLGHDYHRLAPHFAGALFDLRVDSAHVWVTSGRLAVSLWEPPDRGLLPSSPSSEIWAAYRARAGDPAGQRLTEYERAVDAVRPPTPYWYLGVLATHPDRQGEGLASAVMAPVLERADAAGVACCLETSTARNRAFYERRGFTEVTPVEIASGPPTWWLRRPPPPRP